MPKNIHWGTLLIGFVLGTFVGPMVVSRIGMGKKTAR